MPKLTKEKKLEIIRNDFRLWCKNFVKIVDNNTNELIPFVFNPQQEDFYSKMGKFSIICKSRQIGFSTLSLAWALYQALNNPNVTCLILNYDGPSLNYLFNRLKLMYRNIPEEYSVKEVKSNRQELSFENGSSIMNKIAAAGRTWGRGYTLRFALLSEFAFYDPDTAADGLIEIESALEKNEYSKLIIESTPNGMGNPYYYTFMAAYKGNSKYKAFFYPWFSNKTQFAKEYDIAEQWYKTNNHGKRLSKNDLTKYELGLYEKGASLKQLMWRQWKLLDVTDIAKFQKDYPASIEEAFISTSNSVFSQAKILEYMNFLPEPLTKEEILKDKNFPESLIPYIGKGLNLYKLPQHKMHYWGGVDTASGSGKTDADFSAISIFDEDGEQVAVFNKNDIPVYKYAEVVSDLGHYYNYCYYVVERNSYGLPLLQKLREDLGYLNLYKMRIFNQYGKKKHQLGFATTTQNKPLLIQRFKEAFELGHILINDKETLQQMLIYEEKENGSMAAKRGEGRHDDLVMASAFAVSEGLSKKLYYVDI